MNKHERVRDIKRRIERNKIDKQLCDDSKMKAYHQGKVDAFIVALRIIETK